MNIKLNKESKQPVYKQIVDAIKTEIENGELKIGDKLPSKNDLAQQLNISKPTISRAYSFLEDEGILFSQKSKETIVIATSSNSSQYENQGNKIFISYAHIDEDASDGAISKIRNAIKNEYRMQTGEEVDMFFDSDSLSWGSNWRETIKNNIGHTTIFMPFLSPSYLMSANCLGELRAAYLSLQEQGVEEAILPIRFVDYKKQAESLSDDELANLLNNTHWKDFSDLKYEDPQSPDYKKTIRDLVRDIVNISEKVAKLAKEKSTISDEEIDGEKEEKESFGYIDAVQGFEDESNIITEHLSVLGEITTSLGEIANHYTQEIEASTGSFKERILIIKRFSNDIKPLALKFDDESNVICEHTYNADESIKTILDFFAEWDSEESFANLRDFETFGHILINLDEEVEIAFTSMTSFRNSVVALKKLSKDLQEPINTIQSGLDRFLKLRVVYENWGQRSKRILEQLEE